MTAALRGKRRILVLGSSGAGKSRLAVELGRAMDLPVIHLDGHYWRPGWMETPDAEWDRTLAGLLERPAWVMDGNYDRTLDVRLRRADAAILLDLRPIVCRYRVLKRIATTYGRTRADLGPGCPEHLDWEFLRWVWAWHRDIRPRVVACLERAGPDVTIVRVESRRGVRDLLAGIRVGGTGPRGEADCDTRRTSP